jgi:hypothetical protein
LASFDYEKAVATNYLYAFYYPYAHGLSIYYDHDGDRLHVREHDHPYGDDRGYDHDDVHDPHKNANE